MKGKMQRVAELLWEGVGVWVGRTGPIGNVECLGCSYRAVIFLRITRILICVCALAYGLELTS